VSLPEVPLLAVLPGTGGLTRLIDKRRVRRDRADFFCTTEEGIKGQRAVEWRLVDEAVSRSHLADAAARKAAQYAARSTRPAGAAGVALTPLARHFGKDRVEYRNVTIEIERERALANITVRGPESAAPAGAEAFARMDNSFWPLAMACELDDALLHLRFNEEAVGTWVFRTEGDGRLVETYDRLLLDHRGNWLAREVALYLKRVFKRIDVSSRSLFALIEPGSCFSGTLLELALAADRAYMLSGRREGDELSPAAIRLGGMNFGPLPMCNGLSRLESRFLGETAHVEALREHLGEAIEAEQAADLGLIGFAPDEIDWDDEVRLALEERAAFSPDALTGMEASLRFGGPETLETKIFARLSAWQNWIFQRPNATGENGALKRYGSGKRASFDPRRA
jgi:benzoyl-CoA-dihydrodiol lyase